MYETSTNYIAVVIGALCLLFYGSRPANLSIPKHFLLIDEEAELIDTLRNYINDENVRLDKLQKFKNVLKQHPELYATEDEFAWNPLAIYKTVKYLTVDLDSIVDSMKKNSYNDSASTRLDKETDFILLPKDRMYGAIRNLVALQRAYNLTVPHMMDGHLFENVTVEHSLTAEDCLIIGKTCAEKNDHETTVDWLQGCEGRFDSVTQKLASRMIISSALFTGNKTLSSTLLHDLLLGDPNDRVLVDLDLQLAAEFGTMQSNENQTDQWESFNLCSGDYEHEMASRNMKCRYNHHNSPFLTIAPLKEEMLSFVPKVSVFREAVYDSEMKMLKEDAIHRVVDEVTGERTPDLRYRPSQTAFVYHLRPKYRNLRNRLQDMSALSMKYSEFPQMLHYAPGGFYRTHCDYMTPLPDGTRIYFRNRIASALMYFNDVTIGGSTVFPRLKVSVRPVKGSVLVWINMRVDGSEEVLSKHAACPVVYGEKMACTQWFVMGGQDHWIAEPEDDKEARYDVNPNIVCPKRTTS